MSRARETAHDHRQHATQPEDLARLFVKYANAGDVDGLVSLYEAKAVLALRSGEVATGATAIRQFYAAFIAERPTFEAGDQRPALIQENLALTSTRLKDGTVTAEVARLQPDGSWRWVLDQPAIAKAPKEDK